MNVRTGISVAALVLVTAIGIGMGTSTPAQSQYCEGTVHGLSGRYNLATGAGFLAVRARPRASARMVGQLFNGDTVEIFDRRGNWYRIAADGLEGWAHSRWMWNSCSY